MRSGRLGLSSLGERSSGYAPLVRTFVLSSVGVESPSEAQCVFYFVKTHDVQLQLNEFTLSQQAGYLHMD